MKPIWRSKTVWFNALYLLAAICAEPAILRACGNDAVTVLAAIGAGANVILRTLTNQPIAKP